MAHPVLLLEDHKLVTDCYIMALHSLNIYTDINVSNSLHHAYTTLTEPNFNNLRLAVLDFSMPEYEPFNLKNGQDIALIIRSKFPDAKIIFISGQLQSLELESLLKNIKPEAIVEKADINYSDLSIIFQKVLNGGVFYSSHILQRIKHNKSNYIFLDNLNLMIIRLIYEGISTKNMPMYLPISLSAVHKRKAKIKVILNIENSSNEAIIKEAKKRGLI